MNPTLSSVTRRVTDIPNSEKLKITNFRQPHIIMHLQGNVHFKLYNVIAPKGNLLFDHLQQSQAKKQRKYISNNIHEMNTVKRIPA